eukprot:5179079-Ditylum_brightwellii.AAC.1
MMQQPKRHEHFSKQIQLLQNSRKSLQQLRKQKEDVLLSVKQNMHIYAQQIMNKAKNNDDREKEELSKAMKDLESIVSTACMSFLSSWQEQSKRAFITNSVLYKNVIMKQQQEVIEMNRQLEIFALYLERETCGYIRLISLLDDERKTSSNQMPSQYKRCQKAVTENIAKGFFDNNNFPYCGIHVENIFKIENKPLMDMFQAEVSTHEATINDGKIGQVDAKNRGKTKALFCQVPLGGVERFIAYGLQKNTAKWTNGKILSDVWMNQEGCDLKSGDNGVQEKQCYIRHNGYAKRTVEKCNNISLPLPFSKHSTVRKRDGVEGSSINGESVQSLGD